VKNGTNRMPLLLEFKTTKISATECLHFFKAKKSKLLTGLICVLKKNYKYAQKQILQVKQILFKSYYSNITQIL
jgi:hypothetical protein